MTETLNASKSDLLRQILIVVASPLIWIFSSLGIFIDGARSPSDFSDLTENILVPQTSAFSIWFPIFLGIFAYAVIQLLPANKNRTAFRESGWWMVAGLWGIAAWGLVTAYAPDNAVEILASLIFFPTMIFLVTAMAKIWRRRDSLSRLEHWLVLTPISLIAGWCSIAVFVGLNGLVWKTVEPMGWSITGTALSVLGLALWFAIYVLRQKAMNKIYAFPILWGLGFLALRHFGQDGNVWIGGAAAIGIIAVALGSLTGRGDRDHIGSAP